MHKLCHEQMAIAVAASICGVSIKEKFLIQGFSKEMARNIISGSDNYRNNKEFFFQRRPLLIGVFQCSPVNFQYNNRFPLYEMNIATY